MANATTVNPMVIDTQATTDLSGGRPLHVTGLLFVTAAAGDAVTVVDTASRLLFGCVCPVSPVTHTFWFPINHVFTGGFKATALTSGAKLLVYCTQPSHV